MGVKEEETVSAPGLSGPGGSIDIGVDAVLRSAATHRRWHQDALRRRLLASADLLASLVGLGAVAVPATGSAWPLVCIPLWLLAAKLLGLYDQDHRALRHLTSDEAPVLASWALIATVIAELLLTLTPADSLAAPSAIGLWAALVLGAAAFRSLARWAWWQRTPPERVAIIGDEPVLGQLRRKFAVFRDMHFELSAEQRLADIGTGERRAGTLERIIGDVDRVVVAGSQPEADLVEQLSRLCRRHQVKLSVVSPYRGHARPTGQISQLADLPIHEYNTWDRSRSSLLLKRLIDVIVSSVGLLLSLPLLAVAAVAIALEDGRPVMFSQIRAGFGGRPFRMFKLRTMTVDAEAELDRYVDLDALEAPAFKLDGDPRITRVGRVLRRFSIDELPQLANVLLGEMSLVGPRPEQVELVARYGEGDRIRLTAKPGITGPMQVFGRGELSFDERLAVEIEYVENQSLARDVGLIVRTLPAVFRGTGAS